MKTKHLAGFYISKMASEKYRRTDTAFVYSRSSPLQNEGHAVNRMSSEHVCAPYWHAHSPNVLMNKSIKPITKFPRGLWHPPMSYLGFVQIRTQPESLFVAFWELKELRICSRELLTAICLLIFQLKIVTKHSSDLFNTFCNLM